LKSRHGRALLRLRRGLCCRLGRALLGKELGVGGALF
jgi:hypothetical protein